MKIFTTTILISLVKSTIIKKDFEVVQYLNGTLKQYFLLLPFGTVREFNDIVSVKAFQPNLESLRYIHNFELAEYKSGSYVDEIVKKIDSIDEIMRIELLKLKMLQEDLLEYKVQLCKFVFTFFIY